MTSSRPYLIRAVHEWIVDNGLTPLLVVNATASGLQVPLEHARDGTITLNVSPAATQDIRLGNDTIEFNARFNGVPRRVTIPMHGVLALYARENGVGMTFPAEENPGESVTDETRPRPSLRLVE